MQISVSSTLTVYHDGQFWVGLAEHVEGGRYGVARIVFDAEPSDEEILQFVVGKWGKLSFFGYESTEMGRPAKNPKRRAREAAKALKQPAMSTKAQQTLAAQRETKRQESAHTRSRRRAEEANALRSAKTQAKLAQACGMKPANLCRLENGNGNPSVATLEKIAHCLGRKLEISFA